MNDVYKQQNMQTANRIRDAIYKELNTPNLRSLQITIDFALDEIPTMHVDKNFYVDNQDSE